MGEPKRNDGVRQSRLRWTMRLTALLVAGAAGLLLVAPGAVAADSDVKILYERKGCADCHGADGRTPRWDTIPKIAGQMPQYSYLVLQAYKTGERAGLGSNMHAEVNDLISDEQMKALADYIAKMQ